MKKDYEIPIKKRFNWWPIMVLISYIKNDLAKGEDVKLDYKLGFGLIFLILLSIVVFVIISLF